MTKKRFRKLIRAHFTAYYIQNRDIMRGWIANAYRSTEHATAKNYDGAYRAIVAALPITPT